MAWYVEPVGYITKRTNVGKVPSPNEISFVLDVLRKILEPTLKRVETLLQTTQKWGNEDRNDFCRQVWRQIFSCLAYKLRTSQVPPSMPIDMVRITNLSP